MWRCQAVQSRLLQVLLHQPSHAARGQAAAKPIQEHGRGVLVLRVVGWLTHIEPASQCPGRITPHGGNPLFAAFATYSHDVGIAIPVRDIQANEFRDTQTCGVQRLQNRPVAEPLWLIGRRGLKQKADVFGAEKMGQLTSNPGSSQRFGRIGGGKILAAAVPKETPQTGQAPSDRRPRIVACVHIRNVAAECGHRDLIGGGIRVQFLAEIEEDRVKILRVGLQRQR